MTNRSSQIALESESTGGPERVLKVTGNFVEAIHNAISRGVLKISESTVIFINDLKWKKARQIACTLIGPEDIEKLVRANGVSLDEIVIIQPSDSERAAQVLSSIYHDFDLAKVLDLNAVKMEKLLPVISPTNSVPVMSYIEIPVKQQES